MKTQDFETFAELWLNAHAISSSNQRPTGSAVSMAFDVLAGFPIEVIREALMRHAKASRFAPTPADIFEIVGKATPQHLSADEAWAIVVESMDERSTVVMTQEMRDARAIAWPVWESGDGVGARMAFRDAYTRIVNTAPAPRWSISLGYDVEGRAGAIGRAVELGRLTQNEAKLHLPAPREGGPIAGLLIGKVVDPQNNPELKKRWGSLKQSLLDGQRRMEERERQEREQRRLRREQRRAEVLAAVEEKQLEVWKA